VSDQQAPLHFKKVMLPYLDEAYNLARWLMGNAADAENVTHEAMTQARKHFDTFKGTNARAWILRIVRNVAYRALRKRREGINVVRLDPPSNVETEPVRIQLPSAS
jgi:RNA polymerase sigma-70 factor, ECF subfamily